MNYDVARMDELVEYELKKVTRREKSESEKALSRLSELESEVATLSRGRRMAAWLSVPIGAALITDMALGVVSFCDYCGGETPAYAPFLYYAGAVVFGRALDNVMKYVRSSAESINAKKKEIRGLVS